jgi:type VI secretion system FHA domain protein
MTRTEGATLTLEVTGEQAMGLGAERCRTFGPEGGTIGRSASNRWVLADSFVSNRHARIGCQDDGFFVEDLDSRNGVEVNDRKLEKGDRCRLVSGDRIFIEPYEIVVLNAHHAADQSSELLSREARGPADPFSAVEHDSVGPVRANARWPAPVAIDAASGAVPIEISSGVVPDLAAGDDVDWFGALGPAPVESPQPRGPSAGELRHDPLKEHYSAPAVWTPPPAAKARARELIPPDYDLLTGKPSKPVVDPASRTSVESPASDKPKVERRVGDRRRARDRRINAKLPASQMVPVGQGPRGDSERTGSLTPRADLAAVLEGAGLGGLSVTPETAAQFGQILRVVVAGVLDVLQARQQVKGEFRIARTVIQPRRNNPLKLSTSVEDALHNLLIKRVAGHLGPVEAFEDAFNDLRDHQIAMLAGVRVAFEAMFTQFDPDRLQKEFDRRTPRAKKGALAALQGKPDYWDFYRDWMQRMAHDTDGTFRALVGEEFAKAYEDQLDRLKAQAAVGGRGPGQGAAGR